MGAIDLATARANLAAVEAAAEAQRREDAKQKVEQLRREGSALKKQLLPLAKQVREAQAERLRLQRELMSAYRQIQVYSAPADPLEFPSDEDIADRAEQLRLWQAEQKRLLAAVADASCRESARAEAVALEKRVEHIQYEISNWQAIAEGRRPGQLPPGGLASVPNDFIGHTDRRFD
jgi:hypothetical protein